MTNLAIALLSLTIPVSAAAPEDRGLPFEAELAAAGAVTPEAAKALARIQRCSEIDERWSARIVAEDDAALASAQPQIDANTLMSAAACWDQVERRHPTGHVGVDGWVAVWQDVVSGVMAWEHARGTWLAGGNDVVCKRLEAAEAALADALAGAEAFDGGFTTDAARALGSRPAEVARGMLSRVHTLGESTGCR